MKNQRIICLLLTAALIIPMGQISQTTALAGAPTVSTDEAVYVNLDYYGQTTDISIVKSCNLNSIRQFTDYGNYAEVINMSSHVLAEMKEDSVVWNLAEQEGYSGKNPERFYYECKLKDNNALALPWSFDVSYSLNGVPTKGDDLAGKSGLVEIAVHAIPNPNVPDYSKNNMILQVATTVNMDDTLSIEAPGSQIQALGAHKAVLFMALPGEDITFTIAMGTNSFESTGITMMMVPGTLSQMQDIKDLKESKDKVEDAAHAVKDSMDDIIGTMESMSQGLDATKQGLSKLDEGREMLKEDRAELFTLSDEAIVNATDLRENINSMVAHMQEGQKFVTELNKQSNGMISTISETKKNLKSYQKTIKDIEKNIEDIQESLEKADSYKGDRKRLFENLYKSLGDMEGPMGGLQRDAENLSNGMDDLRGSSKNLQSTMGIMMGNPLTDKVVEGGVGNSLSAHELAVYQAGLSSAGNVAQRTAGDASAVAGQASSLLQSLDTTMGHGKEVMTDLQALVGLSDIYMRIVEDNYDSNQALLEDSKLIANNSSQLLTKLNRFITQTEELNDILNAYEPKVQNLLLDSQELTQQLSTSISGALNFITALQASIRRSEESLDNGAQQALIGMIDIVNQSITGIGKTGSIKDANQLIEDSIDKELNRFENETNVLSMDGDLPKRSFTSDKNPEPESVQIILRTAEIQIDDADSTGDLESTANDQGIGGRLSLIFSKIWEKIKGLFT